MTVHVDALVSPHESTAALSDLTVWAESLLLAYAWASSGSGHAAHWRLLPLDRVRRATIGVHFAQTEPHVLRELRGRSALRVVPDTGGVFHPKILIGLKRMEARVLLGSSNLTAGGFSGNTEVNVLLAGSKDDPTISKLIEFVDAQWSHPRAFEPDDEWLERYELAYAVRPRPPNLGDGRQPVKKVTAASDLNIDWPAYVALIGQQERRALSNGWEIRVFDSPEGSYIQEAEACLAAFAAFNTYANMSIDDRKLIAGWGGGSSGYFGRMVGAGHFKNITGKHPAEIGRWLDAIPLNGVVTINQAQSYLQGAMNLAGVGIGAASRLLCMKRPDLFLPANGASEEKIHQVFGIRPTTVASYLTVIGQIWSYPWFKAPLPQEASERRLWAARAALLDAIFYELP
jgi:hypothetical protein